jgi:type IX secretion system PorP/SprF family membrane protein
MNRRKHLLLGILISISTALGAQQIPMLTQSHINPFLLNPAYAGNSDWTTVFLHTRSMWTSMPDAPQQYFLTADGALNNAKIGLGLMVHANVEPIIRNIGALLTYRYKIRLAEHHFLSGGLSGGFVQNSLDFSKAFVANPEEIAEFQGGRSEINFNFNAGLLYQFKALDVGVVVKQLTNTPFTYENTTTEESLVYRLIRHYEFLAAYRWAINDNFTLKPLFVAQSVEGMPFHFMLNACVSYWDKYWIGIGYKLQAAYSAIVGLAVSDRLVIGYNCDIPANGYHPQFGTTHEITIGYRFARQSKKRTPNENINHSDISQLQKIAQRQSEEIDRLKQSNEELQKRVEQQESLYNSRDAELQQLHEIYARDHVFMDSLRQVYRVNLGSITDTSQREIYVILGSYYMVSNAKIFQKILEREAGLNTWIVSSIDKKYYFVYSKIVLSRAEANAELKRLTDMNIQKYLNGNVWFYDNKTK